MGVVTNVLLLFPFFVPYSVKLFMSAGIASSFFYLIDRAAAVARWLMSGYMIADAFNRQKPPGRMSLLVLIFTFSRAFSLYMNNALTINAVVGLASYIGASLLFERMWKKSREYYLKSMIVFFGGMSIIGAFFNIVLPNGFNHSIQKDFAIYFLGSKNSGFYYFVPFLYFYIIYYLYRYNSMPHGALPFCIVMITGAYFTSSTNTIICLLVLFVLMIIWRFLQNRKRLFNPKVMMALAILVEYLILFGKNNKAVQDVVQFFGKSTSFTGRDRIWAFYYEQFQQHVLWGAGPNTELNALSWGGGATHAHNFFLDNLAKYGVIEFVVAVVIFVTVGSCISQYVNRRMIVISSVILFLIILHSLFDDISFYLLICIFETMIAVKDSRCAKAFVAFEKTRRTNAGVQYASIYQNN